jgi:uncharacterized protein (TIGR02996 family)
MNTEHALLQALHDDPADETSWLVLSDWLEEHGEPRRAELLRAQRQLLRTPFEDRSRRALEQRVQRLLAAGVLPCVPTLTNALGMSFALVPAGTFLMGSPEDEEGRIEDESPRHDVQISRPFYLGVHPVTQDSYQRLTGANPSHFAASGDGAEAVRGLDTRAFPVDSVSFNDAQKFCRRLSALPEEQCAGHKYRLPSEAEWEYACRAGTTTPFSVGKGLSSQQGNCDGGHPYKARRGPYLNRTAPVGSYPPNGFGLFDMHGNVWEWCADRFAEDYYTHSPHRDPRGPRGGNLRVLRGGSWTDYATDLRCAYRYNGSPRHADNRLGLRVLLPWGRAARLTPRAGAAR